MNTSDIGKYFKERRKAKAMTQLEVAERLCVSPQAVSKWERSECLPDITLLPEIAKIFGVTVQEILDAGAGNTESGDINELLALLNVFVDEQLFDRVLSEFKRVDDVAELNIPLDFFMVLNGNQKDILLDVIFSMRGYDAIIDDIFQYISGAQRARVIRRIAENGDYESLGLLIPFMSKVVRTEMVEFMLETKNFEFIEEMLPYLNREQKDLIIRQAPTTDEGRYALENFVPFFDRRQRMEIEKIFYEEEL